MKTYLVAGGVALLISLGVAWLVPGTTVEQIVGALTGPEIPFDHITVGGVGRYNFSQSMTQAASTTCNWQTPAATSTVGITARFTLASTSAALIEFGSSAGPQATTTLITRMTLGAGVQATIRATTTATGGSDDALTVAPSTWLAVKIGGGGTLSVPTGTCNFTAETLP